MDIKYHLIINLKTGETLITKNLDRIEAWGEHGVDVLQCQTLKRAQMGEQLWKHGWKSGTELHK